MCQSVSQLTVTEADERSLQTPGQAAAAADALSVRLATKHQREKERKKRNSAR